MCLNMTPAMHARMPPPPILLQLPGVIASILINSPTRKRQALEQPAIVAALVDRLTTGGPLAVQACCTAIGSLVDTPSDAATVAAASPAAVPAAAALAAAVVEGCKAWGAPIGSVQAAEVHARVLAALTAIETMSRSLPAINLVVLRHEGLLPALRWFVEHCTAVKVGG